MLTYTRFLPEVALPPRALEVLSMSQSLSNSKVLQPPKFTTYCTPTLLGKRLSLACWGVR